MIISDVFFLKKTKNGRGDMIKNRLQVSNVCKYTNRALQDLISWAELIRSKGTSCAIYKVGKDIVLMREVEDDDKIQEYKNGKLYTIPLKDAKSHLLADKNIYIKRKKLIEFK